MTTKRLSQVLPALLGTAVAMGGCGGEDREAIEARQGAITYPGILLGFHGGGGGTTNYSLQPSVFNEHVSEFRIWGNVYVDAMQVVYEDAGGNFRSSVKAGGPGGNFASMLFNPGEWIASVKGRSQKYIDQLCLVKSDSNSTTLCVGGGGGYPWGPDSGGGLNQIAGVSGKYGSYIDSLRFSYYGP